MDGEDGVCQREDEGEVEENLDETIGVVVADGFLEDLDDIKENCKYEWSEHPEDCEKTPVKMAISKFYSSDAVRDEVD